MMGLSRLGLQQCVQVHQGEWAVVDKKWACIDNIVVYTGKKWTVSGSVWINVGIT